MPELGAQRVPEASVRHYLTYAGSTPTGQKQFAAYAEQFAACHGRPPTDNDTLAAWIEVLPVVEGVRWLNELCILADDAKRGAASPTNARLLADAAACAAERVLPLVDGQPWAYLVRDAQNLTDRLDAGERGLGEIADTMLRRVTAALRADRDAGPLWGVPGDAGNPMPAFIMTYGTPCQAPLPIARLDAAHEKRLALQAAWIVVVALRVALPVTSSLGAEPVAWMSGDAIKMAINTAPEIEADLKADIIGLMARAIEADPIARDVRALRFEDAAAATHWAALRSTVVNWAPPQVPEVSQALAESLVRQAAPLVDNWRASLPPYDRTCKAPFTEWASSKLATAMSANDAVRRDVFAAFLASSGGDALRHDLRSAALAADPGANPDEAVQTGLTQARLLAGDVVDAVRRTWPHPFHGTTWVPSVALLDGRTLRAALVCAAPDMLTSDEWAMEPAL